MSLCNEKKEATKEKYFKLDLSLSQPTLRREGDAGLAGSVFQERNTHGVATNVYLRKTSEKPEKTWSTNFK